MKTAQRMKFTIRALEREQSAKSSKHASEPFDPYILRHALAELHGWSYEQIDKMTVEQAMIELAMCERE